MAESSLSDNPSKTPSGNKSSWADSKPVKIAVAVIGIGIGGAVVPQQSRAGTYFASIIIGGALGYSLLNGLFEFELNYSGNDQYADKKAKIEGVLVGAVLSMGIIAMRDEKISSNQKLAIATGMGSLLGFNVVRAEFIGRYPDWANWVGAVGGGVAGAGILYGVNKIKNK